MFVKVIEEGVPLAVNWNVVPLVPTVNVVLFALVNVGATCVTAKFAVTEMSLATLESVRGLDVDKSLQFTKL
jgi:hypothetical protein